MVMKYLKKCRVDSYILGKSLCEYVSLMHVQNLIVIWHSLTLALKCFSRRGTSIQSGKEEEKREI